MEFEIGDEVLLFNPFTKIKVGRKSTYFSIKRGVYKITSIKRFKSGNSCYKFGVKSIEFNQIDYIAYPNQFCSPNNKLLRVVYGI